MGEFCREIDGIHRLKIPFERIYTSVFLIENVQGIGLVDCASNSDDVDNFIIPALHRMGYKLSDIKILVLTHSHGDHSGGLEQILKYVPDIEVVTDIRLLFDGVSTYALAGHTEDSIGVFDERTGTLISGDGLQGAGVDKYRCNVKNPKAYFETLDRIEKDCRIHNILFSHSYEPWNKDHVFGRENIIKCIEDCAKIQGEITK